MTPKEFETAMKKIRDKFPTDPERSHGNADDLLCEMLCELGYKDGVDIYDSVDKWYS